MKEIGMWEGVRLSEQGTNMPATGDPCDGAHVVGQSALPTPAQAEFMPGRLEPHLLAVMFVERTALAVGVEDEDAIRAISEGVRELVALDRNGEARVTAPPGVSDRAACEGFAALFKQSQLLKGRYFDAGYINARARYDRVASDVANTLTRLKPGAFLVITGWGSAYVQAAARLGGLDPSKVFRREGFGIYFVPPEEPKQLSAADDLPGEVLQCVGMLVSTLILSGMLLFAAR